MAFKGYQFDRGKVSAAADGSLYDFLSLDRNAVIPDRGNDLAVSSAGLSLTVSTGQALIQGRLIEITEPETVSITASSSGFLVLTIDLSQTNTSTGTPGMSDYTPTINQIRVESVSSLVQQDLHNGGLIYNFSLGSWVSTASTVTFTKNWNAYTPSVILKYGAIFGEDVNNYGSAIIGNKWYSDSGDLIVQPTTGSSLVVQNKDNPSQLLPIKAQYLINSANEIYGIVQRVLRNSNLNTFTNSGSYYFVSGYQTMNLPAQTTAGWLEVLNSNPGQGGHIKQIFYRSSTTSPNFADVYVRHYDANTTTWSGWWNIRTDQPDAVGFSSDLWTNFILESGFTLGTNGIAHYIVKNNVLNIQLSNLNPPAIAAGSVTTICTLPTAVRPQYSVSSGMYELNAGGYVGRLRINSADGTIALQNPNAIAAGQLLSGSITIPLD